MRKKDIIENRTDALNHILENYCKNDKEKKLILFVIKRSLDLYQWNYQNASDKEYRNVYNTNVRVIEKTISLLQDIGDYSLAEQVSDRLLEEKNSKYSVFAKSKILSLVKKDMKKTILKTNIINKFGYENIYSILIEDAFIAQCEEFPLEDAPEHYNSGFEPPY